MKITKKLLSFLSIFAFMASFIFSVDKVFAGACLDGGGTCWTLEKVTDSCSDYTSNDGKALTSVNAGDAACGAVYTQPVKCCKISGTTSSKPAASSKGSDSSSNISGGTNFSNPLAFNTVEDFLGGFLTALQRIIAVLALVMIVIGAIMYITSAGGKQIETAKKTIYSALIGMAIAIAAPSFLKEISLLLGWTPQSTTVKNALTLTQISMNVLNFLLSILGVLALVMLVLAGIMYTTAATDSKQAETGKNIAKYAIYGVIVAMSSMVILQQVAKFFVN